MATQITSGWVPAVMPKASTKRPPEPNTPLSFHAFQVSRAPAGTSPVFTAAATPQAVVAPVATPAPGLNGTGQVLTPVFTGSTQQRTNPYFSTTQFDPTGGNGYATSEVIGGPGGYLETNPQVAYARFLAQQGFNLNDTSPAAQFAQNQYNTSRLGYEAALADSPNLTYQSYLNGLGGAKQLARMFSAQTPKQRGEYQSTYGGPTRTIMDL